MQLVDKYQPKQLDEFVGLARPKAILSNFARNPYASAWLFTGDSGLGKTTFAYAIANLLQAEIHHIPSRSCTLETVEEVCHKCHFVPMFGKSPWHAVIVDEADRMTHPAQLAFLSKLDSTAPPPNTIFFFTSNATELLEKRFLSRCRVIEFKADGLLSEVSSFLRKVYRAEAPGQAEPDYAAIAKRSGSNIRTALMELEMEVLCPSAPAEAGPVPQVQSITAPATPKVVAPESDTLVPARKVAERLHVDLSTIYVRVKKHDMPPPCQPRPMAWKASVIEPFISARGAG